MISPAYIMPTSSQVRTTTPRSWEIIIMEVPSRCLSSSMRESAWAWMVTSRAVVGSSAMRMSGEQARAMAITTRCFMPPENWSG